jgi:hypothetical protein
MILRHIEEFIEILNEDRGLNNSIQSSFASNYEHAAKNSINTANEIAAQNTVDDLLSDAFTEDLIFQINEEKLKDLFIQRYGFTIAFAQSGF